MATRALIRFAKRQSGYSFAEMTGDINVQFYCHWDGYPEHLGVEIANSLAYGKKISKWELENLGVQHGDVEYIYYVWQAEGKETYISIFKRDYASYCGECGKERDDSWGCIFVGTPINLINEYKAI